MNLSPKRWRKVSWELVVFRNDVANGCIHSLSSTCLGAPRAHAAMCLQLCPYCGCDYSAHCFSFFAHFERSEKITIRPCLISTARRRLKVASSSLNVPTITFNGTKQQIALGKIHRHTHTHTFTHTQTHTHKHTHTHRDRDRDTNGKAKLNLAQNVTTQLVACIALSALSPRGSQKPIGSSKNTNHVVSRLKTFSNTRRASRNLGRLDKNPPPRETRVLGKIVESSRWFESICSTVQHAFWPVFWPQLHVDCM